MAQTLKWICLMLVYSLCACTKTADKPPMQIAPPDRGEVMCTQEVMQCPDGSWVGRSGPKCEFVCPAGDARK